MRLRPFDSYEPVSVFDGRRRSSPSWFARCSFHVRGCGRRYSCMRLGASSQGPRFTYGRSRHVRQLGYPLLIPSTTSLGMLGISEGLHVNLLLFAQRKSTSTASYLGSRSALIVSTLPSELSGLSGTFFVPSVGSKLPAWRFGSRASAARASSLEASSVVLLMQNGSATQKGLIPDSNVEACQPI